MARLKKSKQSKMLNIVSIESKKSFLEKLESPKYIIGFFVLLFFILIFLYKPMVFDGMDPSGSDVTTGIGKTHQLRMWEEKTGDYPLWNPYMFAGMPTYPRFGPRAWSLDTLFSQLDFLVDWRIWYFLAGAFGIFLFIKFLGLPAFSGMIAALAFVLMPHFQALIIVGHFAKFRALMWLPYVVLSALYLLKKRTFLSALLFSFTLALQFRTQHYQIIFYTFLLILFMGVPILYRLYKDKARKTIGKILGFAIVAVIFALLIAAQNILSIKEYTPYSTRGGNAISILDDKTTQQEKRGVGFEYATNWSYSVSEWWNLIIPKFHGGTSNELYKGDVVPAFKHKELPTYWGTMPFTQSYEYMGIVIVFLAVIGILFNWKRWEVKSLTFLTIFTLLLSLGKNFSVLYKILFYYVPYFDKFRVPVMILTLTMFNLCVLAAFGIYSLVKEDLPKKEVRQKLYITFGVFILLLLIPLLFGSTFSLAKPGEVRQYGQEISDMLKQVRLEFLRNSSLLSLLFIVVGLGGVFAVQKKVLTGGLMPLIFIVIIAADFLKLDAQYIENKFVDSKYVERQQYGLNNIDKEIQKDNTFFRVFPVGRLFMDTHWVYYYQSIGGYSPAKLQGIQEIVDNNLYVPVGEQLQINWNVIDMLNVKYLITNQQLNSPRLQLFAMDESRGLLAYSNLNVLPRGFFVDRYEVISDGVERLKYINSSEFDPSKTAILEVNPIETIESPDSAYFNIINYEPDRVEYEVYSNKTALLVLSEIYYPKGWKAKLDDGRPLRIYKTNHLLRSVVVPAGTHQITFNFHPSSYYSGIRISSISIVVVYLFILGSLFLKYREVISKKIKKRV
jgi:hypothetical protein